MRKTQNPRNILYLVLSIVIAAGIWYYVDEFNGRVVTQTVTGIPIEYINHNRYYLRTLLRLRLLAAECPV